MSVDMVKARLEDLAAEGSRLNAAAAQLRDQLTAVTTAQQRVAGAVAELQRTAEALYPDDFTSEATDAR